MLGLLLILKNEFSEKFPSTGGVVKHTKERILDMGIMFVQELFFLTESWLACSPEAVGILRMLSDWVLRYE